MAVPSPFDPALADEPYLYLTTTGRRTGLPREIEIWFVLSDATIHLLSGGGERAQWVRNLRANRAARVRVAGREAAARARFPAPGDPEDRAARDAMVAKYAPGYGGDLTGYRERALVVALDPA